MNIIIAPIHCWNRFGMQLRHNGFSWYYNQNNIVTALSILASPKHKWRHYQFNLKRMWIMRKYKCKFPNACRSFDVLESKDIQLCTLNGCSWIFRGFWHANSRTICSLISNCTNPNVHTNVQEYKGHINSWQFIIMSKHLAYLPQFLKDQKRTSDGIWYTTTVLLFFIKNVIYTIQNNSCGCLLIFHALVHTHDIESNLHGHDFEA